MTLATLDRYDPDAVDRSDGDAVVLGASVAGLLAARTLADGFETVTVVERDPLDGEPTARRGVPQGEHLHVLLEAGRATMQDAFPGFSEELAAAGACLLDWAAEVEYHASGGTLARGTGRVPTYTATRPLVEHVLRERLRSRSDVRLHTDCRCVQLALDGDAVAGVRLRDGGDETVLAADVVVDATGRSSRTPDWLADHGYPRPPVDEVHVDLAYATTFVDRPPGDRRAHAVVPSPPRTRGGASFPVEDDRWIVTCWGMHGDHPPTDPDGFAAFAEGLPLSGFERILREHDWRDGGVDGYPFPSSLRRRYADLDRFPDGLVVVGDALASFNPIYGQGMSVAALEALALHHALADGGRADLGRRFFERAEPVVDQAWKLAVVSDFAYDATTGPEPRGRRVLDWYVRRLLERARDDGVLRTAFGRVSSMERPAIDLLHPRICWRVLRPRF